MSIGGHQVPNSSCILAPDLYFKLAITEYGQGGSNSYLLASFTKYCSIITICTETTTALSRKCFYKDLLNNHLGRLN